MTSTLSSSTNGILDINEESSDNNNLLNDSIKMLKMVDKTTSMTSLTTFPYQDYVYNVSSNRPSIEFVKLFINRFLTDLSVEKRADMNFINKPKCDYQSNTNFGNQCDRNSVEDHQIPNFKLTLDNDKIDNFNELVQEVYSSNICYSLDNIEAKSNFNGDKLVNEEYFQAATNQLVEESVGKIFDVILNYEIRKVSKRQWKQSKKNAVALQNLSKTNNETPLPNQAEIIYYEEVNPDFASFFDENVTVNVDENSSYHSGVKSSPDTLRKPNQSYYFDRSRVEKQLHDNLAVPHLVFNHNKRLHKINYSNVNPRFYQQNLFKKPVNCHCDNLKSPTSTCDLKDANNYGYQKLLNKSTLFFNRIIQKSKTRLRRTAILDKKAFSSNLIKSPSLKNYKTSNIQTSTNSIIPPYEIKSEASFNENSTEMKTPVIMFNRNSPLSKDQHSLDNLYSNYDEVSIEISN